MKSWITVYWKCNLDNYNYGSEKNANNKPGAIRFSSTKSHCIPLFQHGLSTSLNRNSRSDSLIMSNGPSSMMCQFPKSGMILAFFSKSFLKVPFATDRQVRGGTDSWMRVGRSQISPDCPRSILFTEIWQGAPSCHVVFPLTKTRSLRQVNKKSFDFN